MVEPDNQIRRMRGASIWVASALVLMVVLSPQTSQAEAIDSGPDRVLTYLGQGGGSHMVHWKALTREQGGSFHLYRGCRLEQLELAESRLAVRGTGEYRVSGRAPETPWFYYQLRYVEPSGDETVLATVLVNQQRLLNEMNAVDVSAAGAKALVDLVWSGPDLRDGYLSTTESRILRSAAPRPEVPPPRATGLC